MCGLLSSIAETPITVMVVVDDVTALQNIDFTLSVSTLSFQSGVTQSCTTVSAIADLILEEDETFTLGLLSNNDLVQILPGETATVTIPNQDCKLRID